MVVLDAVGVRHIFCIGVKECWAVKNRKQRRPFLKEDVDHLVRDHSRRRHGQRRRRHFPFWRKIALLSDCEEQVGLKFTTKPSSFLSFSFEGVCSS